MKINKNGFTLIEIILAMAILSIILVAFLAAFSGGFINIVAAGSKTKAVSDAQAVVDFIYNSGAVDNTALTSNFDINSVVSYASLKTSPYIPAKPMYYSAENKTIGAAPAVLTVKEVTVLVYYKNGKEYITLTALVP